MPPRHGAKHLEAARPARPQARAHDVLPRAQAVARQGGRRAVAADVHDDKGALRCHAALRGDQGLLALEDVGQRGEAAGAAVRLPAAHHGARGRTLNALETVQHSYADGFLQVAVNIVVQQISPFAGFGGKHPLSRVLHNVVVTYLLTEAHAGSDFSN